MNICSRLDLSNSMFNITNYDKLNAAQNPSDYGQAQALSPALNMKLASTHSQTAARRTFFASTCETIYPKIELTGSAKGETHKQGVFGRAVFV